MSSSVLVRATAPFRSFLNQRFDDVQRRLGHLEEVVADALAHSKRQADDIQELQKALLDAMTLLAAATADAKKAPEVAEVAEAAKASASTRSAPAVKKPAKAPAKAPATVAAPAAAPNAAAAETAE